MGSGAAKGATASIKRSEGKLLPSAAPAGTATVLRMRTCDAELPQPRTMPDAPRSGRHSALTVEEAPPAPLGAHASIPVCSAASGGVGAQGLGSASSSPCSDMMLALSVGVKNTPLSAPLKKGYDPEKFHAPATRAAPPPHVSFSSTAAQVA